MIISVINHTNGKLTDGDVQTAVRAINRQITEDFLPYLGVRGGTSAGRQDWHEAEQTDTLRHAGRGGPLPMG